MLAFKLLPLQAFAALACAVFLSGCIEPPRRSNIGDTLDNTSFEPPPGSPSSFGTPARPGSGAVSTAERGLGPKEPISAQVYPGRSFAPQPVAAAQRSGDGVQLNFDRAEIREVARVILGDILGASYTVNADVQGEVTLSSGAPLSEGDLLAVFEAALRSNGASLVETGPNTYQIMTADTAIGRSEIVPMGGRPVQVRPGYGITIIPLRNISATAAAQFIQPLVATPEDIRIDPGRNAILFSGTAAERQNVIDTVRDLDVDWMAGKSIGLFPLERARPEAIIPELQAVFSPFDPTGAEPSLMRFLPIARLNAVLAIGGDAEQIREVDAWVTRLDRGDVVGPQFYVYYLRHGAAEDVAKLLNETYADSGAGGGAAPGPTLGSATTALGGNQDGGASPDDLGGAPPAEPGGFGAAPAPAEPSAPDGPIKVVASRANNALLIKATPEIYEFMEATLLRLDTAPAQVLIEATIAEITLNDQLRYGVQYFLESGSFAGGLTQSVAGATLLPNTVIPGFNFLFTPRGSVVTIDALSRITDVRVLSSPSVVVQDNSEAELTVGDEVPIITRQATGVVDPDSPTVNSVEYRETGVILQVRPRINQNGAVSLEIAQEVSRVNDANTTDELTPTITQRKINSRVSVQSGQTVVLGGLIQDSESRGRDRIPVLGEIPVLGSLFGTTSSQDQRTELIVFITPRVINSPEDARDVSNELRSRLRSLSPSRALPPMTQAVSPAPPRSAPPPPSRTTPRPIVPQAGGPARNRPAG